MNGRIMEYFFATGYWHQPVNNSCPSADGFNDCDRFSICRSVRIYKIYLLIRARARIHTQTLCVWTSLVVKNFVLLIMRFYRGDFSLKRKIPMVTMVWIVQENLGLRPLLVLHNHISPSTSSGQRSCASWAFRSKKSVTLRPQPGGETVKSIRDMWWHWQTKVCA
jgi:hypothetical protein